MGTVKPGEVIDGEETPTGFESETLEISRRVSVVEVKASLFVDAAIALKEAGKKSTSLAVYSEVKDTVMCALPELHGVDRVVLQRYYEDK